MDFYYYLILVVIVGFLFAAPTFVSGKKGE